MKRKDTRYAFDSFRKDYKISGTIGELGQKDSLTFFSLILQISAGKKKNYPEVYIIHAVIRAMSPDLKMKSYLEGRDDITLVILRKLPRWALSREGWQKEGFASQEDGSMLAYNQSLVQSMFLKAIGTGLRDASIAQELKPFLTEQDVPDEGFLEQINLAARGEFEGQQKIASKKKVATTARLKADNREGESRAKEENPFSMQSKN
ncbi:hypothetical protein HOLleu_09913 [Holothuria leucospilota]|uniref:Uncharacterized protein n=1 Tax=Holothuria leucospilota TaxID=206669 RepID=A0A9Q1HE77_HOLLE|nr:hypothetical protein HOLleu_09913 [Holothuria leucospilota]